jgi:23S rRNA (adenine2503-C2)-methyltransferase
MTQISIHDEKQIKELLVANGTQAFRYAQIENAIYKNFVKDFSLIETLPKKVREALVGQAFFQELEVDTEVTSENGQTTKLLFKTKT